MKEYFGEKGCKVREILDTLTVRDDQTRAAALLLAEEYLRGVIEVFDTLNLSRETREMLMESRAEKCAREAINVINSRLSAAQRLEVGDPMTVVALELGIARRDGSVH